MSAQVEGESRVRVPRGGVRCPLTVPNRARGRRRRWVPHASAVPKIIGTAAAVIGLLDVVSAVFPAFRNGRMHHMAAFFPGTVSSLAAATSVVTGILLLMLAHALKRGKQRAWWATVLLLPVGAATQLIYRHSFFGAVVSLALLAAAGQAPRRVHRAVRPAHPLAGAGQPGRPERRRLRPRPGHHQRPPRVRARQPRLHRPLPARALRPVRLRRARCSYTSDRVNDIVGYSLGGLGLLIACSTVYLRAAPGPPGRRAQRGGRGRGCAPCWPGTAPATRSATSRCAATSPWSSRPAARPRSATGWSPVWRWPAATRSATSRRGPAPSSAFMELARAHAWLPAVVGLQRDRRRGVDPRDRPGRPGTRRRGDRRRRRLHPHRPRDAQRPADGQADRALRVRVPGAPGARARPRRRSSGSGWPPTPGAAPTPSAASPWRSAGSARRRTATAWSSPPTRSASPAPRTPNSATCAPSCTSCPGARTACRWS